MCLSVWTSAVFVSEPPQATSTDLHPDLYSLITVIQCSLSLSLFLSLSPLSLSLCPACVSGWTQAVFFVFNTRNAIFLFAEIKAKKEKNTESFGLLLFEGRFLKTAVMSPEREVQL